MAIIDIQAGDILRTHVQGAELIGGGAYFDTTIIEQDGRLVADSDSVTDRLAEKWAEDGRDLLYTENLRTGERYTPGEEVKGGN